MTGLSASVLTLDETDPHAVFKTITRKIIPFLFLCYVVSFLDRINIGFAQIQMKHDLAFSDAIYGLGAGIFFVGYFLFEVPSNMLLERIGARRTFTRIMVCWGAISAGMMFVSAPWQFYTLRFLLGAFEAGFFPGIVLYLTYWYPSARRATVVSWFFAGVAIAGLIGGLISGWIMKGMDGTAGLFGWQWMFVIEGLPACFLGVVAYFYLVDGPMHAKWLSSEQKTWLLKTLELDRAQSSSEKAAGSFSAALRSLKVYLLAFIYFTLAAGSFAISFWVPTLIRESGVRDVLSVGLYSAIPYGIGALGIVLIARRSDAQVERRWHFIVCALVAAAALSLLTVRPGSLGIMLAVLTCAVIFIYAAIPIFWAIPPAHLRGSAAAGGIALISSLGQLGGFVSPYLIGLIKTHTGKIDNGLYVMSVLLVLGALTVYLAFKDPQRTTA